MTEAPHKTPALLDGFGRRVTYLRLSVTDRCDLRCVYCMPERMTFLPRRDVLSIAELARLCEAFRLLGVRKIRLTGGEPLVRRGVLELVETLGRWRKAGELDEVTLTTNAGRLASCAGRLREFGVERVNVSLDTRDPALFARIARRGRLDEVLAGIEAARQAGLAVKLNMVALRGLNEDEIPGMIAWAHERGMDITLIEAMPMGDTGLNISGAHLPLTIVRERLARLWTLEESDHATGGPARYFDLRETGGRLGLITPLTNNFCANCNRVRVDCTGRLFMCLGHADHVNLRSALREGGGAGAARAIRTALARKAERHHFAVLPGSAEASLATGPGRMMSVTGG